MLAQVAHAKREILLRVHRHRLRKEDLEDCYSQATLELLAHTGRGGHFSSRAHAANALEQRFLSRIHDRRRALSGRSPMQAAIETALPLDCFEPEQPELVDVRAELETLVLLREELRRVESVARELTPDQQLILACQVGMQMDLPYGPDGHPDPLGASQEDCSSTVNYVLYRAGVRPFQEIIRENPLAQDYVNWGAPGPGRWVTIYATDRPTQHVFMLIAGLRLDTSHDGTDVGPNRYEDGPRWRILDRIPTWAHWSVRHPPGL
jgi:DNA-directed RNA polymerase specialized sigma24 family protein